MNICRRNETTGEIEIYDMQPNEKRMVEFRKKEMKKIPTDKRVYRARTNLDNFDKLRGTPGEIPPTVKYSDINFRKYPGYDMEFHNINSYEMTDEEQERQKIILQQFYAGHYSKYSSIVKVCIDKKDEEMYNSYGREIYFLLTEPYYKRSFDKKESVMDNIIMVPKSLYLLHLLEREYFAGIEESDITEELSTNFTISPSPFCRIRINDIENAYKNGIIPGDFNMILDNIRTQENIYYGLKR